MEEKEVPSISPFAKHLQFAQAVFETFRVSNGEIVFFDKHLQRLDRSRSLMGFEWPEKQNLKTVESTIKQFLELPKTSQGLWRGKIFLTPDFWWFRLISLEVIDERIYREGVVVNAAQEKRALPQAKGASAIYLRHMNQKNIFETLFFDHNDYLREGNVTNVFIELENGLVVTPKDNILHGIMRSGVLDILKIEGINVEEREVHRSELCQARAMFLTNTIKGVVPIATFEDWKGNDFSLVSRIREHLSF